MLRPLPHSHQLCSAIILVHTNTCQYEQYQKTNHPNYKCLTVEWESSARLSCCSRCRACRHASQFVKLGRTCGAKTSRTLESCEFFTCCCCYRVLTRWVLHVERTSLSFLAHNDEPWWSEVICCNGWGRSARQRWRRTIQRSCVQEHLFSRWPGWSAWRNAINLG